ncbi:MAG: hypothetical protein ACRDIY_09265 [Chloroflexota bacterium]
MRTSAPARQGELLHALIEERGLLPGHYTLFFVTGEGRYLPSTPEIEETSGCVLDDRGRVFGFWLGWDPLARRPALTEWEEETPEPAWSSVAEYQRARQRLGLAPA